ncbi:MAG: hypothetical protein R3D00_20995 [Bacteroidia bacterium]
MPTNAIYRVFVPITTLDRPLEPRKLYADKIRWLGEKLSSEVSVFVTYRLI